MRLNNLAVLHHAMVEGGISRYRFGYTTNGVAFQIFFFAEGDPFELLFGCLANNSAFTINVDHLYRIDPALPRDTFRTLCQALGLTFDPNNKFRTSAFFQSFSRAIPTTVEPAGRVRPRDIAPFSRDIEEADRVYFCGWRDNTVRGEHVSSANLRKTRDWLGLPAFLSCQRRNISSCWTDDPTRELAFTPP